MKTVPTLRLLKATPFARPSGESSPIPDAVIQSVLDSLPDLIQVDPGKEHHRHVETMQDRLRGLSPTEQRKLARKGSYNERNTLERLYGKAVWESLLRNPKLTTPEAARIARMGALPRPLIELILENRAWLSSPQVRRALLTNRKLMKAQIAIVLRATPKNELKLMSKQMGYPVVVRNLAQEMTRNT